MMQYLINRLETIYLDIKPRFLYNIINIYNFNLLKYVDVVLLVVI